MYNFDLKSIFNIEYVERIKFLISESFTDDIQKLLNMDYNVASISSAYIADYTHYMPAQIATKTNFGLIKFSNNPSNIKFGYYNDFTNKRDLFVKLFSRVFNETENHIESDIGKINLNDQFDRLIAPAKRKLNFYKLENDRYASDAVKNLSNYFHSSDMTLYKMLTEKVDGGYDHCYIVRGSSFTARKGNRKHLFWFKDPLDIKNDELFLKSIKDLVNENFKLGIEEVRSSDVDEYLEMLKIIDY
jgi:hypothetical protein